jgi:hypothetical protein
MDSKPNKKMLFEGQKNLMIKFIYLNYKNSSFYFRKPKINEQIGTSFQCFLGKMCPENQIFMPHLLN